MDLREYLFRKKITIRKFAKAIDYSRVMISRVMHGHTPAGEKLVKAIENMTKKEVTRKDLIDVYVNKNSVVKKDLQA